MTQNTCRLVSAFRSPRRRTRTPPARRRSFTRGARSSLQTPSRCRKPEQPEAEQQERHDRGQDLEGDRARVREQVVLDVGVDELAQLGARERCPRSRLRPSRQGYPATARLGSAGVIADAHQRWTLRVVCVSTALLLLNVAAPQVALSAIAESLDASFADLQWVLSGYALALAVFLLTAGSLADRFGRRRLFLAGLAMFSAASALCALAPSAGALIAARLVQGLGAAVVFPASLAILAEAFQGAGAAARDRRLGRDDRARVRRRAADRRPARRRPRLARGVRGQRRARAADDGARRAPRRRVARPRPAAGRLGGRRHAQPRAVRGRLRRAARQRARLGQRHGARLPRPVRGGAGGLRGRRAGDGAADARPAPVPQPHVRGRDADRGAAGGRDVRRVRLRDAVPARRAGPRPGRGRARAGAAGARLLRRVRRGRARLRAGAAARRARRRDADHHRGRARAAGGHRRGRVVAGAAPRPRRDGRRRRAREPARDLRAPRRAAARPGRPGLRAQQHRAPDRPGGRDRRPRARCSRRGSATAAPRAPRSPTGSTRCC